MLLLSRVTPVHSSLQAHSHQPSWLYYFLRNSQGDFWNFGGEIWYFGGKNPDPTSRILTSLQSSNPLVLGLHLRLHPLHPLHHVRHLGLQGGEGGEGRGPTADHEENGENNVCLHGGNLGPTGSILVDSMTSLLIKLSCLFKLNLNVFHKSENKHFEIQN